MSLRQFTLLHNGDYSGEVTIRNEMTKQELTVDTDVLFHFLSRVLRAARISKLENQSAASILGLSEELLKPRPECIPSEKHKHVFWCAAGTQLDDGPTQHDGWHFWDEVGMHGGGPLVTEDTAAAALQFYMDHVLNGPEQPVPTMRSTPTT
jgi:hypothetical protein